MVSPCLVACAMPACHPCHQNDFGCPFDDGGVYAFCEHGDKYEILRCALKNRVCSAPHDHCHCQDQYCSYDANGHLSNSDVLSCALNESRVGLCDGESGDGGDDGDGGDGGDGGVCVFCDGNDEASWIFFLHGDVCNEWHHECHYHWNHYSSYRVTGDPLYYSVMSYVLTKCGDDLCESDIEKNVTQTAVLCSSSWKCPQMM